MLEHAVAPEAVGLEALRIYEERDILGRVAELSPHFLSRLGALSEHPHVGEARGVGMIGAIELVADKPGLTPFDPGDNVGARLQAHLQENGVILRALRDTLAFCPPLIVSRAEIDSLFDAVEAGPAHLRGGPAPRCA